MLYYVVLLRHVHHIIKYSYVNYNLNYVNHNHFDWLQAGDSFQDFQAARLESTGLYTVALHCGETQAWREQLEEVFQGGNYNLVITGKQVSTGYGPTFLLLLCNNMHSEGKISGNFPEIDDTLRFHCIHSFLSNFRIRSAMICEVFTRDS